jgi:hypothetical protein
VPERPTPRKVWNVKRRKDIGRKIWKGRMKWRVKEKKICKQENINTKEHEKKAEEKVE